MLFSKNLSKEEKKELMLNKYVKQGDFDIEDIKKYGVFWKPAGSDVFSWVLICKCKTEIECISEIKWRILFHRTDNIDVVLKNDKRFSTFYDETKNKDSKGKTIEPADADMVESLPKPASKFKTFSYYAGIELNYKGEFIILPVYEIE